MLPLVACTPTLYTLKIHVVELHPAQLVLIIRMVIYTKILHNGWEDVWYTFSLQGPARRFVLGKRRENEGREKREEWGLNRKTS